MSRRKPKRWRERERESEREVCRKLSFDVLLDEVFVEMRDNDGKKSSRRCILSSGLEARVRETKKRSGV